MRTDSRTGLAPLLRMSGVNKNAAATTFVGRRSELTTLRRLMRSARLITIVGPGGAGKTRLAAELVSGTGACAWVDLAQLRSTQDVPPAVGYAVGARGDTAADLRDALRDGPPLVVLDNCEHLLAATRSAATRLMEAQPRLKIIATSRVPLEIQDELAWRAPPLGLPSIDTAKSLGLGLRSDAMRLFVDRARSAQPTFVLDHERADMIASICRQLDGLPLAIELAAARLRHMSLAELADRVERGALRDQREGDAGRHSTMTAALQWSHELLGREERTLFRRLAVFAGSFASGAADGVGADDIAEPLEVLTSLVDRSLVQFNADGERYRLLEPVRQFAEARLHESGESDVIVDRAARYVASLVTETLGLDRGSPRADLKVRVEFPNVAALMPVLVAAAPGLALRAMSRFAVRYRSAVPVRLDVIQDWLAKGLAAYSSHDATRAEALFASAFLGWTLDRDGSAYSTTRSALESSRAIGEETGDDRIVAQARWFLAVVTASYASVEAATDAYDEVVPTLRPWPRMLALAYTRRAVLRQQAGDGKGAQEDLGEAFAAWDRYGDTLAVNRALTLVAAAEVELLAGRLARATKYVRQAIATQQRAGEPLEAAPFVALAHLTARAGDDERALRVAGIAERYHHEVGSWLERRFLLSDAAPLRASEERLGHRAAQLRSTGRRMPLDLAVRYALGDPSSTGLTKREAVVARLVADGMTDKEIATNLRISVRTAENHVQRIRDKLSLRSRAQIARWSVELVTNPSDVASA